MGGLFRRTDRVLQEAMLTGRTDSVLEARMPGRTDIVLEARLPK